MSEKLNFRDKRVIRNYMKPGLLAGLLIIFVFVVVAILFTEKHPIICELCNRIMMVGVLLAILVIWFTTKRYIRDLNNDRKIVEIGLLKSKYKKKTNFFFLIKGREYKVKSDIWETAAEGDKVEIYFSFVSKVILAISLKDKGIISYY